MGGVRAPYFIPSGDSREQWTLPPWSRLGAAMIAFALDIVLGRDPD